MYKPLLAAGLPADAQPKPACLRQTGLAGAKINTCEFFYAISKIQKPYKVMTKEELEIVEIVNRETKAWDTQDVNLLITLFHPDMVWPWPKTPQSHDPLEWELVLGKFDKNRWSKGWQELFDNFELVHNKREIKKIVVSAENDGAFAVVDIDTLWINKMGIRNHWKGRVCKVYSKVSDGWKMTMHTGVLEY